MRSGGRHHPYRALSRTEKIAHHLERHGARMARLRCDRCGCQLVARDRDAHRERCVGYPVAGLTADQWRAAGGGVMWVLEPGAHASDEERRALAPDEDGRNMLDLLDKRCRLRIQKKGMQKASLAKLAEHVGVSRQAISLAIADGRLTSGIGRRGGRACVLDLEAAADEWHRLHAAVELPPPGPVPDDDDGEDSAIPFAEARRRREIELWRQARVKRESDDLDLRQRRGELVPVAEVRAAIVERYQTVKTRLLSVPTRCKQRISKLTADDVRQLEDFIREALEELAAPTGE